MNNEKNTKHTFLLLADGEWAAKASLASVLRTLAWTLLFFWLIGKILHPAPTPPYKYRYAHQLAGTAVTPMATPKSDPRGFRRDIPPKNAGIFRIGWIGGSSLHTRSGYNRQQHTWNHETFVPVEVIQRLGIIDGKKPEVLFYILSSQRIFDSYLCMLDAMNRECDLIIITLNPVWALNSKAITLWTNLYSGIIPALLDDPGTLWSIALLGSPRQIAEGMLSCVFDAVLNRFDARIAIDSKFAISPALDTSHPLKQSPEKLRYQDIFTKSQPLQFWIEQEIWGGQPGMRSAPEWQWAAISYSAQETGGSPAAIITKMAEDLSESGIPALIYVAPIEYKALTYKTIQSKVEYLEQFLHQLKKKYKGSHIRIVGDNPSKFIKELTFRDMVHIKRSEKLSDFLTGEINIVLDRSDQVKQSSKRAAQ